MKKKIYMLLALVMAAMTASADDIPTYQLQVGTNEHGSVTFKVNNQIVAEAAENDVVTMTITPNSGWSVYKNEGVWVATIARVQAQNASIDVSRDVELTPVSGQTNQWTFTMKRANAYFSVSYRRLIQASWIGTIQSQTYNGQEHRPAPVVRVNGTGPQLTAGTDYTVSYDNNIDAGTAKVTVTINPESELYDGSATKKFSITKKTVTVHGITAMDKTYNGNTIASLIYDDIVFDGKKDGDMLTITATGRFTDKNVGTSKTVLIQSIFLAGADKGNYTLDTSGSQSSTTASITKKRLNVIAQPNTIIYGEEPSDGGMIYNGLASGEFSSVLSGTLEFSYNTAEDGSGDAYEAGSPTGTYYIIPSGLSSQNYDLFYYPGVLTVELVSVALAETDDNTQTLADNDGADVNVTLTRTLQPGNWNTFSVPFALSGDDLAAWGITAKELTSSSFVDGTLSLTFDAAESIEAGKPYLVQVDATLENPTFENVRVKKDAVTVETEAVNFIPTLGKTLVTGPEGNEDNADAVLFLAAGNKLTNPSVVNTPDKQSSYMKGFRAFFQLKGDAAMSNLRAYSIDFGDGEATEIVEVDGGQLAVDSDDSWYDLQGRKLDGEPTTKGVYIKNGKKVVVN